MSKTTLVILLILGIVTIIIIVAQGRKKREEEAARQRELNLQYQMYGGQPRPGTDGLAGTITSVGGLLDSFSNLFGSFKRPDKPDVTNESLSVAEREQQCMDAYPNDFTGQMNCINQIV